MAGPSLVRTPLAVHDTPCRSGDLVASSLSGLDDERDAARRSRRGAVLEDRGGQHDGTHGTTFALHATHSVGRFHMPPPVYFSGGRLRMISILTQT